MMFQRDFYLLKHSKRNSRMQNLLASFDLLDRMIVGEPRNYLKLLRQKSHIDYMKIDKKVSIVQKETRAVIKNIMKKYI